MVILNKERPWILSKKLIIANSAFEEYVYSGGKTSFTPCTTSVTYLQS
jgi:hypothetical protein